MKNKCIQWIPLVVSLTISASISAHGLGPTRDRGYEVWASDQSNSVAGQSGAGTRGSYLWIWDSRDIARQLAGGPDAEPIACSRHPRRAQTGPCDLLDVFPQDLVELDADGNPTGSTLGDLNGFGRLHGMLADPQNRYVNANIFAPSGGYLGIIDTRRKEAIALFRVTGTNVGGNSDVRSVHMSFWNHDGSAILIANLHGKLLERIDVKRTRAGKIKRVSLNRSATLGVGKGMAITTEATVFRGRNAHRRKLIGDIVGTYAQGDIGDLTPNGLCRENGCAAGSDGSNGGRPNNVIICPIVSSRDYAYVTMGGGGLLVADTRTTPMEIVGEYGNETINGAGCGGVQVDDEMWLDAGVSASGAGATQSTFTVYTLDDAGFASGPNAEDTPAPVEMYKDVGNTATIGNVAGDPNPNLTGQLPGTSTRRDAHGMEATANGNYVHTVDRIQNVVEVIATSSGQRTTYDLTSADGQGLGVGPCHAKSVSDDSTLPPNDPAPDLLARTPDGKHLAIALRGPAPVSVGHAAQGSCPGVGLVEILEDGASGRLVGVLRTSNTVDTSPANAPGGAVYAGEERSDVHDATVVRKR